MDRDITNATAKNILQQVIFQTIKMTCVINTKEIKYQEKDLRL